jgi:hypothetical protein
MTMIFYELGKETEASREINFNDFLTKKIN